eukprot:1142309-Pelagomonas_calceolata.AAC.4
MHGGLVYGLGCTLLVVTDMNTWRPVSLVQLHAGGSHRYECTPVEALAGAEIQGTSHLDAAAQRPEHEQQGQQQGQQQQQQQEEQPPPQLYNLVLASEVLEHVKRPDRFCGTLAKLAAPGGTVIISTLNRTPASFALGIVGAEYITRVVPRCCAFADVPLGVRVCPHMQDNESNSLVLGVMGVVRAAV